MFRVSLSITAVAVASLASAGSPTVVGNLAKAAWPTKIYASPNSHARIYTGIKKGQLLVVKHYTEGWDSVLLRNSSYGFVHTTALEQLPFEVTQGNSQAGYGGGTRYADSSMGSASRSQAADMALNYIGTVPYKFGGDDLNSGIDCSAFVKKMYGNIGYNLPRTAAEQALVGQPITRLEDLRKGDRLYFWDSKRGMVGHAAIFLGGDMFVHSSHGKGGVATSHLTQSWLNILYAARR